MKPREFFDLVVEMRQAQQGYFLICKSDDPVAKKQALQYSIELEAQVDGEIKRVQDILRRQSLTNKSASL